jgi:CoA:oxalate CoA-transferase
MDKPLKGIRVLDLGHVLAMPTCTMQLADLGAEVIKIERPGVGDDSRYFGPFKNKESAYFISINRNKKSITLDLKKDQGKKIFKDLVKISDVVTENYRPNTMQKLGLGYETLKAINPQIIYASICGFGHKTVYPGRPGYDVIAQATGGIMAITGQADGPPTRVGSSIGDIFSGSFATIGILAALRVKEKTGLGQQVDIAMMDAVVSVLENAVVRYTVTGEIPQRTGSAHPSIAPFDVFEAQDGWFVVGIGNDMLWEKFCKAINKTDLLDDLRFTTNPKRSENYKELKPIITEWSKEKTVEEILNILITAGVPVGEVNTIDKIVDDPNIKLREMIVEVEHPLAGEVKITDTPIKLSLTPGKVEKASPLLGEHTEEILGELLGFSQEEIEGLKKEGVV